MVCVMLSTGCNGGDKPRPALSSEPERRDPSGPTNRSGTTSSAEPAAVDPAAVDSATVDPASTGPSAATTDSSTTAARGSGRETGTTGMPGVAGTASGGDEFEGSGRTESSTRGERVLDGEQAPGQVQKSGEADEPRAPAVVKPPLTKVLLLGDSLIATGFGVRLESELDRTPGVVAYRKGKSASGLARPDFFDWMREAQHQISAREPDVIIILMGGNDGQDLTSTGRSKRRVRWKSNGWRDAYAARVDELLARAWAPGRTIIWLGLPKMGLGSLERKLQLIREIQQARVKTKPGAVYLETSPHLLNTEGELRVYGIVRGKRKTLRAEDGIHFTMAGSDFLADALVGDVLRSFGYQAPEPTKGP